MALRSPIRCRGGTTQSAAFGLSATRSAYLVSSLPDIVLPRESVAPVPAGVPGPSARQVYRELIWLEAKASGAAIVILFTLSLLGLDFTSEQWGFVLVGAPFCVSLYMIPDIYLINKHFRPLGVVLSGLDRGEKPAPAEA